MMGLPLNKPTPAEFETCLPYLDAEWTLLPRVRVVVTLGRHAWDATWRVLAGTDEILSKPIKLDVLRDALTRAYRKVTKRST